MFLKKERLNFKGGETVTSIHVKSDGKFTCTVPPEAGDFFELGGCYDAMGEAAELPKSSSCRVIVDSEDASSDKRLIGVRLQPMLSCIRAACSAARKAQETVKSHLFIRYKISANAAFAEHVKTGAIAAPAVHATKSDYDPEDWDWSDDEVFLNAGNLTQGVGAHVYAAMFVRETVAYKHASGSDRQTTRYRPYAPSDAEALGLTDPETAAADRLWAWRMEAAPVPSDVEDIPFTVDGAEYLNALVHNMTIMTRKLVLATHGGLEPGTAGKAILASLTAASKIEAPSTPNTGEDQ